MYKLIVYSDELYHYGVKGMRWGIRRYQNYDGTRIGTGGEPVTNQAKAAGNSIALGQGGKANGIARLAAKREPLTKEQKKALADHLTSDNVKQGKGRDNISPLEDATKDVGKITDSSKKLTEIGKKHDPKVKEAGEKAEKEAKKMSDKELRDKINRIKMEREYKSLAEEEVESGWDKAHEILDVAGDILGIMGTLASLYLTYKIAKGKVGIGQSDVSDAENELKSFMESNEFDEEVIAHFMDLDDEYVETYLEHHGVKGMKWGVRRYQNPDGTRISTGTPNFPKPSSLGGGVGSGVGGGGGGSKKASTSFRDTIVGGQGGKAEGNARFAATVSSRPSVDDPAHKRELVKKDLRILDKDIEGIKANGSRTGSKKESIERQKKTMQNRLDHVDYQLGSKEMLDLAKKHGLSTDQFFSKRNPSKFNSAEKRVSKDAKKDAEEFARAKAFYGEGAGNRRKAIKTTVESKMKKDDFYSIEFEYHLSQQDMEKHMRAAKSERNAKDTVKGTKKALRTAGDLYRMFG